MIRRKKSSSGRSSRRKRPDSSSPPRRRGSDAVLAPPEFAAYDYEKLATYLMKAIAGQHYPFLSNGFVHLIHELEAMLATNQFTKEFMAGEAQYINEGYYPTPDLNARLMPVYDVMPEELTPSPSSYSDADRIRESSTQQEEDKLEICLLPEEYEEDDWDTYVEHVGTCFWSWCRRTFMGKIDSEYLENFKETVLDAYSSEALQRYFVNEPWKYRKKAPPPPPASSRRKSGNSSTSKKKVSIASSEVTSPSSANRSGNRKALSSLSGYRIPNRRHAEKESVNNNKIVPMIGSMVMTACRELKEAKTPDTPTTRRGRTRMASREQSRERDRKCAKIEVDVDDEEEVCNGSSNRISPRLHSPRQPKKEKVEDDYEELNGHCSTNGGAVNGHSKEKEHVSPKRKNGDIRNWINGAKARKTAAPQEEEPEVLSDIEDFDAKAIGSRIVAKLIAGGILTESSAHIFEQMTLENDEEEASCSTKVEMSEEGRDEAEDTEVGELAEELQNLQMGLRDELPAKKALFMLAWRRAKAHFAFFHTFDELRRADYDLFKLGVNMYKEYPRKLPSNSDMPVLRESLQKRNRLARMHYSKMYRRQPKYRWHRAHVPAGKRTLV